MFSLLGPDLYHLPSMVISNYIHFIVFNSGTKVCCVCILLFLYLFTCRWTLIPCLRSQKLWRLIRACELKAERTNLDLIAWLICTVPFFGKHMLRFPQDWLRGGSQCRFQNGLHIAPGTGHSPRSPTVHINTKASSRPQLQPPLDTVVILSILSSFGPK